MRVPNTYTVAMSALIPAPAAICYDVIADYREGHPSILPQRWFGPLTVEAGGVGEGTRIRYEMRMFGKTRVGNSEVTEPVPGHVIVETDVEKRFATTFTVEHVGSAAARVTIETRFTRHGGWITHALERAVVPRVLRRVYAAELALLDERAGERADRAHAAPATAPISMGQLPTTPAPVA